MAQKRRGARAWWRTRASRWLGLAFIALGLFLSVSLATFDPGAYHAAWERHAVRFGGADEIAAFAGEWQGPSGPLSGLAANAGGSLGVLCATLLLGLLGWVAVGALPLACLAWGWNRTFAHPVRRLVWRTAAAIPLVSSVAAVAAATGSPVWGGALGESLWAVARDAVGGVGGALVLAVATIGFGVFEAEAWDGRWGNLSRALLLGLGRTLRWITLALGVTLRWIAIALGRTMRWLAILFGRLLRWLGIRTGRGLHAGGRASVRAAKVAVPAMGRGSVAAARYVLSRGWESGVSVDGSNGTAVQPVKPLVVEPPAPVPADASAGSPPRIVDPAAEEAARRREIPDAVIARGKRADVEMRDIEDAVLEARRQVRPGFHTPPPLYKPQHGKVVIPGTEILDDVPEVGPPVAEEELLDNSRTLTETLRDFGVTGRVGEVHPGPVITRYEYVPGPGVKVAQILNREDDLALKLRASRIRIIAPIPGKAAVGIEVPNRNPAPIFLRRLLETRAFQETTGPLPLALGRDIGGAPVITELSRMPHLLIAGTTGSGKSVCMNALITSLLLKRTPEELRLLMIDPKMLELPMYNGIPHLLTEVVTDPRIAVRSLKWLLLEMERRYRVLSARNCRNILSYNMKIEKEGPIDEGEEKLPYIVVLVDELADLMITSGKEVEEPIARLAQTARAVGIHLIIATQRPSVDVITGVIKANFPSRIAFQVATRTDSRTILDQNGAESLLGKGDMLYLPPGQAAPLRVHGAFVSETETLRLAEAWRSQGEAQAHPDLEDALAEPEAAAAGSMEDARFEDAARLVVSAGQASASLLQRRLKVGYARAARLVDMLEQAGVVSPQDGSKAREVLVDEVRLEHVLAEIHE
jgi:S-DNA-T family DNA segregation ATPase FtsK/SpoIIIE